ncbi:hypothetical protein PPERSA_05095 [Pseudocohnilembus persalinus]|uniref:AB hydrolase-1 domain-containing protein n=1 Tax=Pseudocohnilembus persalinus TaxID=266149 RepID=A0A0V0QW81_PSEPJ|nr:hypothetical protein PPERSA_05095 [Pseudocohnilembus persalinus]|eukprot:KRX06482.1 hypothetical protein PPERSA_05095 [Pseudocohnilembus persalinus]
MNIQEEILPEHIISLKQKYGKNSKEDFFIYNSEIFTDDERKLFNYIHQFQIETKTEKHLYSLNTRFLYREQNKKEPCFMLHGHDKGCTWISWLQLALILFENGRNVLLMDLPGFGKSTVDGDKNSFTIKYKNDSHNMVKNMINIFQLKNVHAVGWCGGGANFYRTIAHYPKLFGKNHIFHNVVISQIPTKLVKNLEENNMKIWVSWMLDDGEHSQYCMAYKWLQEKNKQKNKNIKLQVIQNKELPCVALWSKQMGKKTDDVYMSELYMHYKKQESFLYTIELFLNS